MCVCWCVSAGSASSLWISSGFGLDLVLLLGEEAVLQMDDTKTRRDDETWPEGGDGQQQPLRRRDGLKAIVECPENAGVLRLFVVWALATAASPLAVLFVVYEALRCHRPEVLPSEHLFLGGLAACAVLVVLPIAYGVLAVREDRREAAQQKSDEDSRKKAKAE